MPFLTIEEPSTSQSLDKNSHATLTFSFLLAKTPVSPRHQHLAERLCLKAFSTGLQKSILMNSNKMIIR